MTFTLLISILIFLTASASARWCPKYSYTVYKDEGRYPYSVNGTVNRFRGKLGGQDNGNEPGPLMAGHRSINWDAAAVPFDMPGDFFKNTVTRGALFTTLGNKFAVSNPVPPGSSTTVDNRFSSFNKAFPKLFRTFSPERLFTSVNSNVLYAEFSVPAKSTKAYVSGFAAVFTNVVKIHTTGLIFYDKYGCRIAAVAASPKPRGLSFAGVIVKDKWGKPVPAIAKVVIKLGDAPIVSTWKAWKNFVVLDDLIYGEPQE